MEEKPRVIKKTDILLIMAVLVTAALFWGGYRLTHHSPGLIAEVTVDGNVVAELDLDKDQDLTVLSGNGGRNHLIVKDGKISCDEASCPDKICIGMGRQYLEGSMIVCLPNSMIVQIRAEK